MKLNASLAVPAVALSAACGDGGGAASNVNPSNSFSLSNIETVSNVNIPTAVYSYDVAQNNINYQGYIITNNGEEFRAGDYEALAAGDYTIVSVTKRESDYFGGVVEYNGREYGVRLGTVGDNEILMAIPRDSSFNQNGWNIGDNESFPENAVLRVLGESGHPVSILGEARYVGQLYVIGGAGTSIQNATLDVNFNNSSGTFTARSSATGRGVVWAPIDIDNATGHFSSDDLRKTFDSRIDSVPITGNLAGHFTDENQNGAIGAIWSDPGQPQFKGVFALRPTTLR